MPFNNYSQRDPAWANQRLGTCDGVTIGTEGCLVTAHASIASHFRKDINPAQLDDIYTNRGLYVDGCLTRDNQLTDVYPDIPYLETFDFFNVPADFSVLVNSYEDEYVIEVDADPNTPGVQTHFNRFYDYDASSGILRIIDSWTGNLVDVAAVYGDPVVAVQKIVHYQGPSLPVSAPLPPVVVEAQDSQPVPDPHPPVAPLVQDPIVPVIADPVVVPELPVPDPELPLPPVLVTPAESLPSTTTPENALVHLLTSLYQWLLRLLGFK